MKLLREAEKKVLLFYMTGSTKRDYWDKTQGSYITYTSSSIENKLILYLESLCSFSTFYSVSHLNESQRAHKKNIENNIKNIFPPILAEQSIIQKYHFRFFYLFIYLQQKWGCPSPLTDVSDTIQYLGGEGQSFADLPYLYQILLK